MISRKDNILKKPYEEKRFENHRRKVKSALPMIDNRTPESRHHVHYKGKKQLQEKDRIDRIQKNNFLLLRKLTEIKKKCRVDHYWNKPLPQVVKNKVALFDTFEQNIIDYNVHDENDNEMEELERRLETLGIRKTKCNACTPQNIKKTEEIPEERVPWETQTQRKSSFDKKLRSKSVPSRNAKLHSIKERAQTCLPKIRKSFSPPAPRRLILTRGCLKLSVNFPVDTLVTLQEGNGNKVISGGLCQCKKEIPLISA